MALLFYVSLIIVLYTYIGYGVLLYMVVKIKWLFGYKPSHFEESARQNFPEITMVVAAFNEEEIIGEKLSNTLEIDYPADKLKLIWVTDGSTDKTRSIIDKFDFGHEIESKLFHSDKRNGKIAAVDRVMKYVESPFVIFSDANSILNSQAAKMIVRHFQNRKVGVVCGEKKILPERKSEAAGSGESLYWKMESKLKAWDSDLYSAVGAAGELFSIRTALYETVPADTIIEDFYLSMRIAQKGYIMKYEPQAMATEKGSLNTKEELKRKIRIAAGGFQAVVRLRELLNIFRYGVLSFQYISHRVLRWTVAPLALISLFFSSLIMASSGSKLYILLLFGQVAFYLLAIVGMILQDYKLRIKLIFVPYYFCVMNYAIFRGFFRFLSGSQSVVWEKSKRA